MRNSSIHAAAVVIAEGPLTDIVPLQLADSNQVDADGNKIFNIVTQFSMKPVEQLGLLKMDFLGLRNLDVIEDALDIIERSTGARPGHGEPAARRRAARTRCWRAGDSIGVFQFESEGMQKALRNVRPTEFDDLVALVALYRPGAMDSIPDVRARQAQPGVRRVPRRAAARDHRVDEGRDPLPGAVDADRQAARAASRAPRRTTCARRSARRTARRWRSSSRSSARAAARRARATRVIEQLWATNVKAADYSFNKSHAACYALIAYRTAWLKANYPAEYMAALISSVMSTKDKVPFFATQAEQMGIEILPPDVNVSDHDFVVFEGNIRFGLDAVKGVGYAAVEAIKAAREEGGPFDSLWDFCARVDARAVNKKAIEALIKCGAFGSTGATRKGMLMVLEQAQGAGQKAQQDLEIGQGSIFDSLRLRRWRRERQRRRGGVRGARAPADPDRGVRAARAAGDREGVDRPVHLRAPAQAGARGAARASSTARWPSSPQRKDKDWVSAGGIITAAKKIRTRNGEHMMFATLDDLEGSVEILVFGKALAEYEGALGVDSVVVVRGRVDHKDADKTCLVVQSVEPFEPTPEEIEARAGRPRRRARSGPLPLHVRLDAARRCRRRSSTTSSTCWRTSPASRRSCSRCR